MRKLLVWLPLALVAAILITFIIANRHPVELVLVPGAVPLSVPLYLVFFLGIFVGLLLAALYEIIRRLRVGMRERRHQREISALKAQVDDLEAAAARTDRADDAAGSDQTALAKH